MPTVSRGDRIVDAAALALILLGIVLYLVASSRLHAIGKLSYKQPGPATESALAAADRARYIANGGAGLIAAGCLVGAAGAIRVARRRTRELS